MLPHEELANEPVLQLQVEWQLLLYLEAPPEPFVYHIPCNCFHDAAIPATHLVAPLSILTKHALGG